MSDVGFDLLAVIDRFESSWPHRGPAAVRNFLAALEAGGEAPADGDERVELVRELIKVDLEYCWRAARGDDGGDTLEPGERRQQPQLEDYLQRCPELGAREELPLDLIEEEYRVRRRWGDQPARETYLERFPWCAAALCDRLTRLEGELATQPGTVTTPSLDRTAAEAPACPRVEGYVLLDELGRGSMGMVYRARETALDRLVALKVFRTGIMVDARDRSRFHREARAIARLQHPNIVQVFGTGQHDGWPFLVMELMEAGTLAARIAGSPLLPRDAAVLVVQLAAATQYAHDHGVIHRDLKPANVLLTGDDRPKIADFGLAKYSGSAAETLGSTLAGAQTQTGAVLGTPSYMAPEQVVGARKEIGPAADVYALGAILYEVLTGKPPFRAATVLETLDLVRLTEPIAPRILRPSVPRDLETICLRCLQKEPARRYSSARELADDLGRFLRHEPIVARPIGAVARAALWGRRHPVPSALGLLAALSMLAALAVSVSFAVHQSHAAARLRTALNDAERNRREADRLSANLACERALDLCRQGEIGQGLLWFANGLTIAARTDDEALRQVLRRNLTDWSSRLNRPLGFVEHDETITAAAFCRDGSRLLTGSADGTARLWDATTQQPIGPPLRHRGAVCQVGFSPSGVHLLTRDNAGSVSVWKVSRSAGATGPPVYSKDGFASVDLSPDGSRIVTGGREGVARVWRFGTGDAEGPAFPHGAPLAHVRFSPDGRLVLTVGEDGRAQLWEVATGRAWGAVLCHRNPVHALTFSPDGRVLLTASADAPAQLWDTATGLPIGGPLPHDGRVLAVAFSADSRLALTACNDWRLRIWRITPTTPAKPLAPSMVIRHPAPVTSAAFSPDGSMMLSACRDGLVRLWDAATGEPVGTPMHHRGEGGLLAFRPDGRTALSAGGSPTAWLWELVGRPPYVPAVTSDPWPYAMAFSPDRSLLAVAGEEGKLRLWDLTARAPKRAAIACGFDIRAMVFAPDGQSIWVAGDDPKVRHWDLATGEPTGRSLRHEDPRVTALDLSRDGRLLVTGTAGGMVSLWQADSATLVASRPWHRNAVFALALSPDSRYCLSGGADHSAQLWKIPALAPIHSRLEHLGMVSAAAFSPDSRLVLTGGEERIARLWAVASGRPIGSPFNTGSPIRTAVFSPDGSAVFLGGVGLHSGFWDLATRKPLGVPETHVEARVLAVAFDADSQHALAALDDLKLRLFHRPKPKAGTPTDIRSWAEALTGMSMSPGGELALLSPREWRQRLYGLRSTATTTGAGSRPRLEAKR